MKFNMTHYATRLALPALIRKTGAFRLLLKTNLARLKSAATASVLCGLVLSTAPARASMVTSLNDGGPGSLRQAIQDAGAGATITFAVTGTLTLTNGELFIGQDLNVVGPGAGALAISANFNSRVFNILSNNVSLSGLTICNGWAPSANNSSNTLAAPGGAIYNEGTLALNNCVISNSIAGSGQPGIAACVGAGGGGIWNRGTLRATNCVIRGNRAGAGSHPDGPGGTGGGLFNSGTATLVLCSITQNWAGDSGGINGVVDGPGYDWMEPGGHGGGIFNAGALLMLNCSLSRNRTGAPGRGDPFYALVASPDGGSGGGLYNAATATLYGCTVSSNVTSFGQNTLVADSGPIGSVSYGAGGNGGNGGGIYSSGTLAATNCTLAANSTGFGGNGGYDRTPTNFPNFNGANGGNGGSGAGIYFAASGVLVNCTIFGNTPGVGGSGGLPYNQGTPGAAGSPGLAGLCGPCQLLNCIVVNSNANLAFSRDVGGTLASLGHNLVGITNGASGFVTSDLAGSVEQPLDPKLASLGDTGGPTLTCALLPGSPAIDAGDDSVLASLPTDQRGVTRNIGAHVDIGAFEYSLTNAPLAATLPLTVTATNPATASLTVQFSGSVNPQGSLTAFFFQYGLTSAYGAATPMVSLGYDTNPSAVSAVVAGLVPDTVCHCRVAASNQWGVTFGLDVSAAIGAPSGSGSGIPGDLDGDGMVSAAELNAVLTNYWPTSPWLKLTNTFGLGGTNVTFALTNSLQGAFSVEVSTNLTDWQYLGPAIPRYEYNDPTAPSSPQRFYRLRWP